MQNNDLSPQIIFWDFDGTIKDTMSIKANAFVHLFNDAPEDVKHKILQHHQNNGGMSRYEKIPLYMSWCNMAQSPEKTNELFAKFKNDVVNKVIQAKWIDGFENVVKAKNKSQENILMTATPQDEIELIVEKLKIKSFFTNIYGAPKKKYDVVQEVLKDRMINNKSALIIGDSQEDYSVAQKSGIEFLLVDSNENSKFNSEYRGRKIRSYDELR